jgi:repressor LexA
MKEKNDLTEKQHDVYQFIKSYTEGHGYSPTLSEIGQRFAINPTSVRSAYMMPLMKKGFITMVANKGRTIRVLK